MIRLAFHVDGVPVPQGSTRAFATKKGDVVTTNDPTGSIAKWRGDIRRAARDVLAPGFAPLDTPVRVSATFTFARPKKHYLPANSRRPAPELRADAPRWCIGRGDADKHLRSVLDALSAVVYVDDEQVVQIGKVELLWSRLPGADIVVTEVVE